MAIQIATEYPGKTNAPDANYPLGSAKNVSSSGAGDGTPWEEVLQNDYQGFFQKLLTDAGISASGVPDTVLLSDFMDALTLLNARTTLKILASTGYTVLNLDLVETILVTTGAADRTITIPAVVDNPGRGFLIKKVDSGAGRVLIKTQAAGETIDGVDGTVGISLDTQFDSARLVEGDGVYNLFANLSSGTFTPTLTGITNYSAGTPQKHHWSRVNNIVTVFGRSDITATSSANALIEVNVSLPIAKVLASSVDLAGSGVGEVDSDVTREVNIQIIGNTSAPNGAKLIYYSRNGGSETTAYSFSYTLA